MATTTTAPPIARRATHALSFDERLALAVLAVDARTDTQPIDLADVIRVPVEAPAPAAEPCPYNTPLAALLHRARVRLEAGWCTGRLRDEQGAVCLVGAIRAEAHTRGQADDACALLLEVIRREFVDAQTVASWNDAQTGPRLPLRMLNQTATLAHARGI